MFVKAITLPIKRAINPYGGDQYLLVLKNFDKKNYFKHECGLNGISFPHKRGGG
jgi:hypothetical protein